MPGGSVLNIDAANIFAGLIGHPKEAAANQAGAVAQANAALEIAKLNAKQNTAAANPASAFNWNYVWYGLGIFLFILILILIFKST